ncbi:ribosylnicotinamide kinase [Martiniozyma asiatica (nom. inval.)]|nr:ribosylnicotinamide kinase [Martiniozyma asiatica]
MKTVFIGITGASSSGKSTICKLLASILCAQVMQEDDYFKSEKDVPFDKSRGDYDWDCPGAIDMDQMINDLKRIKKNGAFSGKELTNFENDAKLGVSIETIQKCQELLPNYSNLRIILIDGFLLLQNEQLMDLLDFTLFFKTSYDTLKRRRQNRKYIVDGNDWVDPPGYFETFVWPGYYLHHQDLFADSDEESVRISGGELKLCIKEKWHIGEFSNDDDDDDNDDDDDEDQKQLANNNASINTLLPSVVQFAKGYLDALASNL